MRRSQSVLVAMMLALTFTVISPITLIRKAIPVIIQISPSDDVAIRLKDIDLALSGDFYVDEDSKDLSSAEARVQRVIWNLNTFAKNPLYGSSVSNERGAFHLYWLYHLATLGLIGFVPFALYILWHVKYNIYSLSSKAKPYYIASFGLFIIMGLMKNITGWFMYLVPYFIAPCFYYLMEHTKESNQIQLGSDSSKSTSIVLRA